MGKPTEVNAKLSSGDRVVKANVVFGDNLPESVKLFGEEVVYGKFIQSATIELQAFLRRLLKAEKTDAEIASETKGWQPGVKTVVRRTPLEKATVSLDALTPEQRKELLAKYK